MDVSLAFNLPSHCFYLKMPRQAESRPPQTSLEGSLGGGAGGGGDREEEIGEG